MKAIIDGIVNGFIALFNVVRAVGQFLLDQLLAGVYAIFQLPSWVTNSVAWVGGFISVVVALCTNTFTWISGLITGMQNSVSGLNVSSPLANGPAADIMAFLNVADRFAPMHEAFACFVIWSGVYLLCTVIRMIKGTIPGE